MYVVNITDLKNHLSKYLSKVRNGTEIWVTSHNQIIARIMPPISNQENARQQLKQLRKNSKIGDIISSIDETWDVN